MSKIILKVNNQKFSGWKTARVTRSMEQVSGDFALEFSDRWAEQEQAWQIKAHDAAEVLLDDITVITGYVDSVETSISGDDKVSSFSGRDKTGDLVDCSALADPGEWKKLKLDQIAEVLSAPFGIEVVRETSVGDKFFVFKLQPGESVFEALERMGRMRGVLLTSNRKGNLVITSRSSEKSGTPLIFGDNILEAKVGYDFASRFSSYETIGQQGGKAWGNHKAVTRTKTRSISTDSVIKRFRPKIIFSESQADNEAAKKRVQWEATVRAARSLSVEITVQGWKQSNGELWKPNILVDATIPPLHLKSTLLLVKTVFSSSEDTGTRTELTLRNKESFDLQPDIKLDVQQQSASGLWGG